MISGKMLVRLASAGESRTGKNLSIEVLGELSKRTPRSVYQYLETCPMPDWLLKAAYDWLKKNGPLSPIEIDEAFRRLAAEAWNETFPPNPFDPSEGKAGNRRDTKKGEGGNVDASTIPPSLTQKAPAAEINEAALTAERSELEATKRATAPKENAKGDKESTDCERDSSGNSELLRNDGPGTGRNNQGHGNIAGHNRGAEQDSFGNIRGKRTHGKPSAGLGFSWSKEHLNKVGYAKSILSQINSFDPVPRAMLRSFLKDCAEQPWALKWKSTNRETQAYRFLKSKARIALRRRAKDPLVKERAQAIVTVVYPVFAAKRSRPYSKGAYADKAKTSRRTIIQETLIEQPTLRGQIDGVINDPRFERLKKPIKLLPFLEKIIRRVDGGANPVAEVQAYQSRGLAPRALRVGQIVYLDGSTTKATVKNSFGTASDDGYQRPFFFLCRDVASRKIFGSVHTAQSEDYGWGGGLPSWDEGKIATSGNALVDFLQQMGRAPEIASIDRKSGAATQLLYLHPDKPINVMPGFLLWLGCGTIFHIRQGGRKTGGSYIERDVRTFQDYIEGVEARLSVTKELAGQGFRSERQFDNEIEYRAAFNEALQKVNSLLVKAPSGFEAPDETGVRMRAQIWADAVGETNLATGWLENWISIVRKARVCTITKRRARFGYGKESRFADLDGAIHDMNGPLADYSGEEQIAIAMPGGLLASDVKGLVRVFIIDRREGMLPRILRAEAHVSRVDEFCQDVRRPTPGHYHALPDREQENVAKFRDTSKETWKREVGALVKREATTGTYI